MKEPLKGKTELDNGKEQNNPKENKKYPPKQNNNKSNKKTEKPQLLGAGLRQELGLCGS